MSLFDRHSEDLILILVQGNRNLRSNIAIEFEIDRPTHGFCGFMRAMQLASSRVAGRLPTELRYRVGRILRQIFSSWSTIG